MGKGFDGSLGSPSSKDHQITRPREDAFMSHIVKFEFIMYRVSRAEEFHYKLRINAFSFSSLAGYESFPK